jgi:hypothetical protein
MLYCKLVTQNSLVCNQKAAHIWDFSFRERGKEGCICVQKFVAAVDRLGNYVTARSAFETTRNQP